jgi:STE24 endopeptidase
MLMFIMGIYTLYILVKMYISLLEMDFVKKARKQRPVVLDARTYIEAAEYKIDSQKISLVSSLYDFLLFFGWIGFGLSYLDNALSIENPLLKSIVYVDAFIIVNYILSLPFELFQTFNLDKRYGFSTIDIKTYIIDQIKSGVMFLIFGSLLVLLISWIMLNLANWWIWGFVAIFAVVLFINMIYPTLIAPIFNKFTPLEDDELRSSIEALLAKAGLKSSGVFSIDASKRDKRLNAYFGGLGKSKRVVLFDTLIQKLQKHELLAVLGHELGHFKHKDILKNIASSAVLLLVMFGFFGNLPNSLFEALHVNETPHMVIVLFFLLSPVLSFILMPLMSAMSRANEYAADEYGSECESKEALGSALMKLAGENKAFPLSHKLTIVFYHSHPELVQRLERLGVDIYKNA